MARISARLQLDVRTPHGAPVPGADVRAVGAGSEILGSEVAEGSYCLDLPEPGDYMIIVSRYGKPSGFDHRTLRTSIFYAREGGHTTLLAARQPEGVLSGIGEIEEGEDGTHRATVTLDYLWFTPVGYPPTLGNRVEVLVDGEVAWASIAGAISQATRSVHLTTWIYQPTAELVRPEPISEPEARAAYTAQRLLEERARAGAVVRFLLWDAPVLGLPAELHRAAADGGDRFQVLEEANPTRRPLLGEAWRITNEILGRFQIGSFHQKIVVVDGRVGFCGGMNIKENDWDTPAHLVFEPRRCAFARPASFRAEVAGHAARPDHPPRHDFMARVEGPAVAHIEENFRERWNRLVAESGEGGGARVTPVAPPEPQPPAGTTQVQVVRTMPEPWRERGILDVYLRAISAARRLIYIEDQYFRSTYVSDAIADAIRASPELAVIVLTSEIQANELITGGWSHECFARIQRRLPSFELYTLRVSARDHEGRIVVQDVDNHAKLLIVDDLFLMVGSCNVNDRGFEFEGELNVAIADGDLARQVRLDLWREHLGGDTRLQGDIAADIAVWREHADRNRGYDPDTATELPASNVFPFAPKTRRWMLVGSHVV